MRPSGAKNLNAGGPAPGAPEPPLSSSGRTSRELLFDSEAILRLVDGALTDLRVSRETTEGGPSPTGDSGSTASPPKTQLSHVIADLSLVIGRLLDDLRAGRQELPARRLQSLYGGAGRLEYMSSTATMLDRLGTALVLVDALEGGATTRASVDPIGELRHELFSVMNCLQFHSDTVDRLNRASTMLAETEARLEEIAISIDSVQLGW